MKNGITKITVWGDSILKGAVTGKNTGHLFDIIKEDSLTLAKQKLDSLASENEFLQIDNQSVFGSTITKTQKRLNKTLEKHQNQKGEDWCDLAIIESGGNDCDYDWNILAQNPDSEMNPRTSVENFIRILDEMIQKLRQNHITPLVMTMPPLVGDWWYEHVSRDLNPEVMKKFTDGNIFKLYQNHEFYNLKLMEFCTKNNVQMVDMRKAMLSFSDYRKIMCRDGIHPNEDGYKYMSEIWIQELPKIKKEF